jgi:ketosteroid isomerase-like protein
VANWYDDALQSLMEAFNSRDFSRIAAHLADDAQFDWSRSISDHSGVHRGPEAMRGAFEGFVATWDHVHWEITKVDELGPDRVLVSTRVRARPRGADAEIEANGAQLVEFRDGKVVKATLFQGRDDALEALAVGGDS